MAKEQTFEHPPRGHVALLAYDFINDLWRAVRVSTGGNLSVSIAAATTLSVNQLPFTSLDSKSGTAADAYSAEVQFDAATKQVIIYVETNPADVVLVTPAGVDQDALYVPADSCYSLDFAARGFKVRNHTAGSNAAYWIEGLVR